MHHNLIVFNFEKPTANLLEKDDAINPSPKTPVNQTYPMTLFSSPNSVTGTILHA
jgi:hypothetical protein